VPITPPKLLSDTSNKLIGQPSVKQKKLWATNCKYNKKALGKNYKT
jgi:hypothetical protein